ncbi:MAG TPA: S8 family serine peptidase, partial [Gemmataceae bacterium]|nr:S8 family serine peptidase [Gemmataceae bacterium]
VTVGVLSDSFDTAPDSFTTIHYADDIASGDLPAGIQVLQDFAGDADNSPTDEGRAMLQLIHDVAPGASLAFATAEGGQAAFASNILALRDAGAKVIVDDVRYFAEPMFQDGIIAQTVDEVVASGVSYFSSAGNSGRVGYESDFRAGTVFAPGDFEPSLLYGEPFLGGTAHDFDPGPGVDVMQRFTLPADEDMSLVLDWDSPFFSVSGGSGSPNDVDIYVFNTAGQVLFTDTFDDLGGDAFAFFFAQAGPSAPFSFDVMVVNRTGPAPGFLKYVVSGEGEPTEFATNSGTVFGHANTAGAEAVGAVAWFRTPEFGVDPALLNPFSSAGTTPILFDTAGNRLATPVVRDKPDIVAPDGGNTTFFFQDSVRDDDTFPNFFGTSAAAPHAAAVAGLMLQARPDLTPADVFAHLESTALDMADPGYDHDTGFGLIQALAAVQSLEPSLTVGDAQALEGEPLIFDLTLSNAWFKDVVLRLTTSDGTANGGVDHETTNFEYSTAGGVTWIPAGGPGGTDVTIPAGSTAIKIRIDSTEDSLIEADETFTLQVGTVVSGAVQDSSDTGTGTVLNDEIGVAQLQPDPSDPTKLDLVAIGTTGDDRIEFQSVNGSSTIEVIINGVSYGPFQPTGILIGIGLGGDDTIMIEKKIALACILYGGEGSDTLISGNGPAILVGGYGDDVLSSGNNRDILIGGNGDDRADGGNGEDILIAGRTSFDAFSSAGVQALRDIQNEWLRTDQTYEQRVSHLTATAPGGLNGTSLLRTTGPGRTVFDDLDANPTKKDKLTGGNGRDWYFANLIGPGELDDLIGLVGGELVQEL